MLQPLPLQSAKVFLGGDGESKQPVLNVPILAGNLQTPYYLSALDIFSSPVWNIQLVRFRWVVVLGFRLKTPWKKLFFAGHRKVACNSSLVLVDNLHLLINWMQTQFWFVIYFIVSVFVQRKVSSCDFNEIFKSNHRTLI